MNLSSIGTGGVGGFSIGYKGFAGSYGESGDGRLGAGKEAKVGESEMKRRFDSFECTTCENRRYQDDSPDSGVSMQTPTKVDPKTAESAVRAHEYQHVTRNTAKANREGKEIVSQSVTVKRTICPECGESVVAGGETRTVTKEANNKQNPYNAGLFNESKGKLLDTAA
ncbi:MAG: hypothetical protein FWG90_07420 [Oscillospiraceae bacterium]|nr:hypothetical protein [Oscillospiraceae bacterium]